MLITRKLLQKLTLILISGLLVSLTACGGSSEPAAPAEDAEPAAEESSEPAEEAASEESTESAEEESVASGDAPYTFCFSNASVSNSWRVSMVEHLRWAVEQNSDVIGQLIETDANDDPNKQISDTEDLLTQDCDILIISPSTAEALTPVAQKAMDQGIPVVTVDRNVSDESAYVSYIVADNCAVGRLQAEWLVDTLGGEGQIVLMSGIAGASPAEERLQCARDVFAQHDGIEEIAQEYTNWSPVEGKQTMENWLLIFSQIDGVWSDSGLQASGAVEAFVEAGVDVPPITGEDFNRFLKQMDQYGFEGVVVPFSVQQGNVAVETALKILAGEEVDKTIAVESVVITKDNLADYVRTDLPDDYWAGSLPQVAARLFPDAGIEVPAEEESAAEEEAMAEGDMVDTSAYAAEAPYTFCFSNASVSNSWRVSMVEHLRWAVEQNSDLIGELIETDANDDPNKQISDTEDLLTQDCDILIISPSTAEALTPVAQKAMEQGIPVVTVDRNVSDESAYVSYVVADNCTLGRLQAEWLAETLGGEGQIVLMSGIAGASPAEERLQCARDVFAQYDGLEEIAQEYTNWSPVEGKQTMENWLLIFPQIDGVWSDSGLQASGAVEAFVEAGVDVPPITGEDFNRFLKQMDQYGFEGVVVPFSVQQGNVAVETALKVLAGEDVAKIVPVESVVITKDNLADYVRTDLPDDYWAGSLPQVAARLFPDAVIEESSEESSSEEPAAEVEAMAEGDMVDTSAYVAEAPYTFCFSNASVSNSWRVSMVEHLRWAVEQNSDLIGELIETDANDDPNKQISDTEDLLTQDCDILIISPATAEALTPVAQQAMAQGIPVVTVDRNVSDESAYVSYVVADNCTVGRLQAEWLAETLGGEGQIALMSGIAGASPAEERLQCARDVFAQYDGLEEIAQEYTNWSPVEGKQTMENWLLIFPEIDGVWSDSGLQASGAVEAFVEAGVDVPPITGEDFNRFLKQMDQYGFEGVVVPFSVQQGNIAVETALKVLAGEAVAKTINTDSVVITQDNLADYVRTDLPDDYWAGSLPEVTERLFPN